MKNVDYYEFLQISPNAEEDTIHRVYRFLAARFHPDNPDSGDVQKFSMLTNAYEVLSDPHRRAAYDLKRQKHAPQVVPLSTTVDFMDQLEGETNRRLAVLAVLYYRRRSFPHSPEVPLAEIELRMGFPRDYLDFTTWYLQKKGYITKADNSDFTLTATGVDYVETQRVNLPILNRLLTQGSQTVVEDEPEGPVKNHHPGHEPELTAHSMVPETEDPAEMPITASAGTASSSAGAANGFHPEVVPEPEPVETKPLDRRQNYFDRRKGPRDRRVGMPDLRENPVERRVGNRDRRSTKGNRRRKAADREKTAPVTVH